MKGEEHEGYQEDTQTRRRIGGVPSSEETREKSDISNLTAKNILQGLSWLDRFLSLFIILAMILGVVIGVFAPNVRENLNKSNLKGVSAPLVIGLIVMMWPILTKVSFARCFLITLDAIIQSLITHLICHSGAYETFGHTFKSSKIWLQNLMSLLLNWILGPFLMLGIAWATLPDLEEYRIGIIPHNLCRAYCLWKKFLPIFGPLPLVGLLYTVIIIFAVQARHILDNLGPNFSHFRPVDFVFCYHVEHRLLFSLVLK